MVNENEFCACWKEVTEQMAARDVPQEVVTDILRPGRTYVETEWTRKRRRGEKKIWLESSYCPFCGVKYPERVKRGI